MKRSVKIAAGVVVAVVLSAALLVGCVAVPEQPAGAGVNVDLVKSIKVQNDATIGGALTVAGAIDAGSLKVAATPVALQLGALAGKSIVCGSTVITGTGTIPHGLATPSFVTLGLGQDVTGNGNILSFANASGTVTVKAWSSALTPAPATTPVAVNWCVNGTR
jgi:hypothetical protein